MPLTYSENFNTAVSPEEAAQRFSALHEAKGGKVTTGPDGSIEATTGKKAWVRILGAFFVPRSWWPLKTTLHFTPAGTGTSVEMTVADNWGVGIRTGMKGKYDELMQARAAEVKAALS